MRKRRKTWGIVAVVTAWLLLVPGPLGAQPARHLKTAKSSHRRLGHPLKKSAALHSSSSHASERSHRSGIVRTAGLHRRHIRKAHVPTWKTVRLQSDRVSEIQRSLAEAGYLKTEPTGRWDDATRDAMRRYQTANGFPATGLPESKSLMKLGLGPHALPHDLDPTVAAQVSGGSAPAASDGAVSGPSPNYP